MNIKAIGETVALGGLSGMRSMAGPAVLAVRASHQNALTRAVPALAIGEMVVDKLPFVPDRIEPLPLAGRAFMGALVGGLIARENESSVLVGGMIGAAAAIIAAHLAYRARIAVQDSLGASAGLIEDGVVMGIASAFSRR